MSVKFTDTEKKTISNVIAILEVFHQGFEDIACELSVPHADALEHIGLIVESVEREVEELSYKGLDILQEAGIDA